MSSKHHHDDCCCEGGYGMMGGYGGGYAYGAGGCGYGFNRWIYALLILIVIVLQFGRNRFKTNFVDGCEDGVLEKGENNGQLIDNSVLFIIIVFLLIICAGCWGGSAGCGFGGGYGN